MKSALGIQSLKRLWEWWKRVARKIGDFQARVILTLFYFLLLAPFALVVRLGTDPLAIKAEAPRGWLLRNDSQDATIEQATRQF